MSRLKGRCVRNLRPEHLYLFFGVFFFVFFDLPTFCLLYCISRLIWELHWDSLCWEPISQNRCADRNVSPSPGLPTCVGYGDTDVRCWKCNKPHNGRKCLGLRLHKSMLVCHRIACTRRAFNYSAACVTPVSFMEMNQTSDSYLSESPAE